MNSKLCESTVEEAALEWLAELRYPVASGPELAPGEPGAERVGFGDVVLIGRLRAAVEQINPQLPAEAVEEVVRKVVRMETPSLIENNHRFHQRLVDGVDVQYAGADGRMVHDKAWLVDWEDIEKNDWLALNQFTVVENKHNRRPDVVVFINGLPLVVVELKNPADENATTFDAFNQLQTYKAQIPSLVAYNGLLIVSDGIEARVGTLTADWERFAPWRTIDGSEVRGIGILPMCQGRIRGDRQRNPRAHGQDARATRALPELEVLLRGVMDRRRLLDLIRYFTVFEVDGSTTIKKIAGYHQYHAVNKAVECTAKACSPSGERRVGVVWHTQGSGKSLTMAFYAGKVVQHPAMQNPTLIVLTDRNDLDDQLFGTFARCHELLRQKPAHAEDRQQLRELLSVASGGVVFTTLQKFAPEPGEAYPQLTDRRNVIVIADEAHRSQYGLGARVVKSKDNDEAHIAYGFAKHLRDAVPNASFIGFTGTPIERADKSTPAVFGDYIDIYDIQRAVEDHATVGIYYEGRLAKLELKDDERPKIDADFEEVTEKEEVTTKEKLKTRWARLEVMVGSEKRIDLIAKDIVEHWDRRLDAIDGKAMIVCMSRRICVELHDALIKLRPKWFDADDLRGAIKVVMTGDASDPLSWQRHIRSKGAREGLAKRFKDPNDGMKLVIVRDMWLTGFDAPCLHTMYIDKPMQGHGLMQAIARVNRVFKDKPAGLVVDCMGLADQLKKALADYTEQDRDQTGVPIEQAIEILQEKYEVVKEMFHGFNDPDAGTVARASSPSSGDMGKMPMPHTSPASNLGYSKFFSGTPGERVGVLAVAMDFILDAGKSPEPAGGGADDDKAKLPGKKERYLQAVTELSLAYALVSTQDAAVAIREEVAFFQCIRAMLVKMTPKVGKTADQLDHAVRQIISRAVASDEVINIFAVAGLDKPNISILSDEFLAEVQGMPQKNLALEVLRKLLNDEIKSRSKKNLIQSRLFSEMLEATIRLYQNRSIDTAQVIAELVKLAKEMREAARRGENLGLTDDEVAFYDALEVSDSAVKVLGDETLRTIARELVGVVRRNVTIDWTVKENVRAKLRVMVKKILREYGYPPDKQEKATQTVLEQAEMLCRDWAA